MQVVGDVEEGGPCTVLASAISSELEGGLKGCNFVALEFQPLNGGRAQTVYDLWLVSGPTHWTDDNDHPVVDFYEKVTLGQRGDTEDGKFDFKVYDVGGQKIVILVGRAQRR